MAKRRFNHAGLETVLLHLEVHLISVVAPGLLLVALVVVVAGKCRAVAQSLGRAVARVRARVRARVSARSRARSREQNSHIFTRAQIFNRLSVCMFKRKFCCEGGVWVL